MYRHVNILRDRTTAASNGTDEVSTRIKNRLAAAKHDSAAVGLLDGVDVAARLAAVL